MRTIVWVTANLLIAGVYYVLALNLAKLLGRYIVLSRKTTVGMMGFFVLCGYTHIENAYHVAAWPTEPFTEMLAYHSLIPHILQAVFVLTFLFGVLSDLEHGGKRTRETLRLLREHREEIEDKAHREQGSGDTP